MTPEQIREARARLSERGRHSTHWQDCWQDHADCLAWKALDAIEERDAEIAEAVRLIQGAEMTNAVSLLGAVRDAIECVQQAEAAAERPRYERDGDWINRDGEPTYLVPRRVLKDMPEDHPVRRWFEVGRKPADDPAWPDPGEQVVS